MRLPATAKWLGLALLGLLIAAAVAIAASRLASQQIGLASEPISAGDALAPAVASPPPGRGTKQAHHRHRSEAPPGTTPANPPLTTPTEPTTTGPPSVPSQEHTQGDEGGGGGGGGGHGADD